MENIETTEQAVVLQLNGVTVDMDVIAKDAEIEMNNNEDAKMAVEKMANQETMPEMPAEQLEQNDEPKTAETEEGSTNTMHMDNGDENDVHNEPTEGDLKVVQADETNSEATETTPEPTPMDNATVVETEDENQHETETPGTSENLTENSSENSTENSSENLSESSSEKASENSEDTSSSEQNANDEQQKEDTVTATPTPTPSVAANDTVTTDATQSTSTENADANETMKSDSSKKSPKKKSLRKRKNRSRSDSQKKEVDYTKFEKYTVNVNQRQRRYFLVGTRGSNVPVPGDDCEIFCTNIPINVLEGELIPLFERYGKIWELRLMMSMRNPKRNAGFAFVRFTTAGAANEATQKLNNYEIVPGKHLSVRLSQPNLSLFVGNIHRGLTQEQIHEKLSSKTTGLVKTFVKTSLYEETKNCGFCFLEYDSHSEAIKAKRLLNRGNVWGRQLFVDWAQRRKQPEEGDLNESKTLFINYLPKETTEQQITDTLAAFGTIKKITKIKDYAFVLFEEHEEANNAMTNAEKTKLGHENVEISLAMPKSMKSRPRQPSYNGYNHRRSGRHRGFNGRRRQFSSSSKFYMRHQRNTTNANDRATHNGPVNAATEQTQMQLMAMPSESQTVSHNVATDMAVAQTTILPMPDQPMNNITVEALVH